MAAFNSADYWYLWAIALAVALYFPVRHLIWVLYVRRHAKQGEVDQAEQDRLKRRAGVTAGLLCFVFSLLYTNHLFSS